MTDDDNDVDDDDNDDDDDDDDDDVECVGASLRFGKEQERQFEVSSMPEPNVEEEEEEEERRWSPRSIKNLKQNNIPTVNVPHDFLYALKDNVSWEGKGRKELVMRDECYFDAERVDRPKVVILT
ncbi:hypothetical protein V1477_018958 [Vespula maculifrons]|uniref:Uncharacterized protein n=1 Tax=Vespula maculifrons TaxID=7453 RepID=A0ABD2ATL1_VESMC